MVMDMEAGLEHLSRATDRASDVMLVVLEPYYKSLETAGRVKEMAAELGIPKILGIANKVRNQNDANLIAKFCENHGMEIAASLPYDEQVALAAQLPQAPIDACPEALAMIAVRQLAAQLAGMTVTRVP